MTMSSNPKAGVIRMPGAIRKGALINAGITLHNPWREYHFPQGVAFPPFL